jgi:ribosomal protein L37AE/L43A
MGIIFSLIKYCIKNIEYNINNYHKCSECKNNNDIKRIFFNPNNIIIYKKYSRYNNNIYYVDICKKCYKNMIN